jgi:TldD protein
MIMQDQIHEALKHSRADYTEIRIEERETTQVAYRGRDLENAGANLDKGGIVRCLIKDHGWGMATFNNLDDLRAKVNQAYDCARVAHSEEPIDLAEAEPVREHITVSMGRDFRDVSLAEKKAVIEQYNEVMLSSNDKIVDTTAVYADNFTRMVFANSEGTFIEEERPHVAIRCFAVARDDDNVQQAFESSAGPHGFEFVMDREELARTAARHATELLQARPVQGGKYTVVANQALAGVFIHEAFGHMSEADFVYENPKASEMMTLGRRFGPDILNAFDDGSLPNLRGSHRYDDEGTPSRRNILIQDGILVGRMHSRETAARMGEKPLGNARAINYRFSPIVRMTNTGIANGHTPFEDMIADIELGIYACDAYGGQTSLENFSFSSGYAYMIRHGKIAEMVKDVILAGNLFTTMMNIDTIGNDFKWHNTAGGCGKGNQYPLPVATGSPHIRIQNVIIGGQ